MARMIPTEFPDDGEWTERQLFEALRELDDDWVVVHSVRYYAERDGKMTDGEVDFVMFHPRYGGLCVEVKGGTELKVEDNVWRLRNRDGWYKLKKSPFEQVIDNKYTLASKIQAAVGRKVWLNHAVCFPALLQRSGFGGFERELVWDKDDLVDPVRMVQKTMDYHAVAPQRLTKAEMSRAVNFAAPTTASTSLLRSDVVHAIREQLKLTDVQRQVMSATKHAKRLWVTGAAGTGKTVLAVERARQLAAEGRSVLLLCFNTPLGSRLRAELRDEPLVTADSFHQFALGVISQGGKMPNGPRDQQWQDEAVPLALIDAADWVGTTYDALIIDEGQDFRADWLEILISLTTDPENAQVLMFSDGNQTIYRDDEVAKLGEPGPALTINCRNTRRINDRVNATVDIDLSCLSAESPVEPTAIIVETRHELDSAVARELHRITVEEEVDPADVVLLSNSRDYVDELHGKKIGNQSISDLDSGGLVAETIHRFKGLDAPAVILAIPPGTNLSRNLAYIGFSRARVILSVIAPAESLSASGWAPS